MATCPAGVDLADLPEARATNWAGVRMAKDDEFAQVVHEAWAQDTKERQGRGVRIHSASLKHHDDGTLLHSRLFWAESPGLPKGFQRPGILNISTAGGPNDWFMIARCEKLAALGYLVLNVDLFGDALGNTWDDTTGGQVWGPKREALRDRPQNLRRLEAAAKLLRGHALRAPNSGLGAVGYCLGGRAVLDVARARIGDASRFPDLRASVSFHGILDDNEVPKGAGVGMPPLPRVLALHGGDDPLSPKDKVAAFEQQMGQLLPPDAWKLVVYPGARHSFTNAAQALHPDQKVFGYDATAAKGSWDQMVAWLEQALQPPKAAL